MSHLFLTFLLHVRIVRQMKKGPEPQGAQSVGSIRYENAHCVWKQTGPSIQAKGIYRVQRRGWKNQTRGNKPQYCPNFSLFPLRLPPLTDMPPPGIPPNERYVAMNLTRFHRHTSARQNRQQRFFSTTQISFLVDWNPPCHLPVRKSEIETPAYLCVLAGRNPCAGWCRLPGNPVDFQGPACPFLSFSPQLLL